MATTVDARGVEDLHPMLRRSWVVPLVLGILLLVAGVIMLVNVNAGVRTLRWLVVIDLVLTAVQAFATASLRSRPWVGALLGVLYLVAAVIGIVWPGVTLLALVLVVGVSLLVGGVVQAGMSWASRRSDSGWGWSFALGLIAVLGGLVFLFGNPVISIAALAIVLAVYTIIAGVMLLTLATAVRRMGAGVSAAFGH